MRVAVIVSGKLDVDISRYIPSDAMEVITTGGKEGQAVNKWADENYMPKLIIKSDKRMPLSPRKSAEVLVQISENVVAVWDGTRDFVSLCIDRANAEGKPLNVIKRSVVVKRRSELLKKCRNFLVIKQYARPVVHE
jgi:hypothetical protein